MQCALSYRYLHVSKPKENHMGLGKNIVKKIVKNYNGLFDTNIESNVYEVRIMIPVYK